MIKSLRTMRDSVRAIGTAVRASSEYSRATSTGDRFSDAAATACIPL